MTPGKIKGLLSLGEGQRVEFKSSARSLDTLGKEVCGFLNSAGGFLVCGVNDKGEVVGIESSSEATKRLEELFTQKISPKTMVAVQVDQLAGKPVILIEVPSGKDGPYSFKDVIYIRLGDRTEIAQAETIRDMVMRHQLEPERWERRFSFAEIDEDVDVPEVLSAVLDAKKGGRAFFRESTLPTMVLEDFSVARYGRLTNGGDILFALNPAVRFPQIRIRAMRYNSDKAGDTFRDMKFFEGPLLQIFEEAYYFIVRNIPSISRFTKSSPKRQDSPLYPEEAVREALINALAHRDYSAASGGVSIHIFPNRLEIWNSGALPEGVSVGSLLKGQISVLRNPDISHVLYLRGLMEKAGRGSVLMVQKCLEKGLPPPFWKSDPLLGVTVTFPSPEFTPDVTPEVWRLLRNLKGEMNRLALLEAMGLKDAEHFRKSYLLPALEFGLVEMTIPDKPRSSKQKYRLTALGAAIKKKGGKNGN